MFFLFFLCIGCCSLTIIPQEHAGKRHQFQLLHFNAAHVRHHIVQQILNGVSEEAEKLAEKKLDLFKNK